MGAGGYFVLRRANRGHQGGVSLTSGTGPSVMEEVNAHMTQVGCIANEPCAVDTRVDFNVGNQRREGTVFAARSKAVSAGVSCLQRKNRG